MISAEKFAKAGDKYIGRLYSEMDCQKFFEQCARDCGLNMDLPGSNAWYRKFIQTGWTGSPEECIKKFGSIPNGATLFIHAYDGGEEKRGYHDGLGNASHIGIKTGRTGADMVRETGRTDMDFGDGAVHSSSSRKHVCTSRFKDKTISGGGWNMVGLSNLFDYGDKINRLLPGGGGDEPQPEPTPEPTPASKKAVVDTNGNGRLVTHPKKGAKAESKAGKLDEGTPVEILKQSDDWSYISVIDKNGAKWYCWVKSQFLRIVKEVQESQAEQDEGGDVGGDVSDVDGGEDFPDSPDFWDDYDQGDEEQGGYITIRIQEKDAATFLSVLELIEEQIAQRIGRG